VHREGQHQSRTAGAHFALDLSSTHALPLLCHAPQRLLELAEPVFRSLRRRALNNRAADQRLLVRDTLANFADIDIGREWVMRVDAWLLTPSIHNGESNGRFLWRLMREARLHLIPRPVSDHSFH
jgi:hypothetical protein